MSGLRSVRPRQTAGSRELVDTRLEEVLRRLALNEDATISVVDPLFGYGNSKLLTMVFLKSPGDSQFFAALQASTPMSPFSEFTIEGALIECSLKEAEGSETEQMA